MYYWDLLSFDGKAQGACLRYQKGTLLLSLPPGAHLPSQDPGPSAATYVSSPTSAEHLSSRKAFAVREAWWGWGQRPWWRHSIIWRGRHWIFLTARFLSLSGELCFYLSGAQNCDLTSLSISFLLWDLRLPALRLTFLWAEDSSSSLPPGDLDSQSRRG